MKGLRLLIFKFLQALRSMVFGGSEIWLENLEIFCTNLFLYYDESLLSSNLNSKQLRFHGVRPNLHVQQTPKPSAHAPDAAPFLVIHSSAV